MKASFRVGGILLAAGAGRRFGNDKRRARLHDGTTLLQRSLDRFAAVCDTTLLVLGPREDAQALGLHPPPGVTVMNAPRSAGGMGFSLADAIGCAEAQAWDACLVSLGDKPFISERTLHTVRELLARHDFVVPTHGGAHGHPVGFARRYFAMLARLEGDAGARGLIREHGGEACFVELDDAGMLADVDTPEQLDRLQRQFADG
ncbi:MAG: nucleotidyltransferase family protein [Pseudomonadales bacterium]|nr:nucleotidyltransferase family protein [Pseudomonadales bacterium]MCP5319321.1 nucleotidyltransferase family protein [Pseudomonadales bacterium]MCP5336860.1 nucleotidyltransferase family protein [Pseudomonadales bacterium]